MQRTRLHGESHAPVRLTRGWRAGQPVQAAPRGDWQELSRKLPLQVARFRNQETMRRFRAVGKACALQAVAAELGFACRSTLPSRRITDRDRTVTSSTIGTFAAAERNLHSLVERASVRHSNQSGTNEIHPGPFVQVHEKRRYGYPQDVREIAPGASAPAAGFGTGQWQRHARQSTAADGRTVAPDFAVV